MDRSAAEGECHVVGRLVDELDAVIVVDGGATVAKRGNASVALEVQR